MKTIYRTISADIVRSILEYNPETGEFKVIRGATARPLGKIIKGSLHRGYYLLGIGDVTYYAHRLAFVWMTGKMPMDEIDHIDGDTTNNKWSNLRIASKAVNMQNLKKAQKNNAVGLLGVTKHGNKFKSEIATNGKRLYLGLHVTPELAHEAYLKAKRELHPGNTL